MNEDLWDVQQPIYKSKSLVIYIYIAISYGSKKNIFCAVIGNSTNNVLLWLWTVGICTSWEIFDLQTLIELKKVLLFPLKLLIGQCIA